jgi:hypothetical protein
VGCRGQTPGLDEHLGVERTLLDRRTVDKHGECDGRDFGAERTQESRRGVSDRGESLIYSSAVLYGFVRNW